jgi:Fe2+ transport system protein FeoA
MTAMNASSESAVGITSLPVTLSPLDQVKVGKAVRIRELCGTPEVTCRLREIGLGEGQIIRLIASHTNIICQVCQARLALNAMLARLILVESLPE